ncbi:MAG: response regulator transcription factor [Planctomycetes bacterium]|nr:response regulator transcription factor [Planctomycetota bacterium]
MSQPTRILIADSDIEFSKKLQDFLDKQEGIKVIDVVRDGQGAVNTCKEALPDLVLMDLHLPVLDSIRATKSILTQNERIKILGLSSIPNDRYAVEAIKVGASGCVEKNGKTSYDEIIEAIRLVENGEVLLDPKLASSILQEFYRLSI